MWRILPALLANRLSVEHCTQGTPLLLNRHRPQLLVIALSQNQRCPGNVAFRDAVARRPLYVSSKRDAARYILERIERFYGHKEMTEPERKEFQIEHVMPQTLTDSWRNEIAPNDPTVAEEAHAQWLHTLGNLTLTAYNPELSNQSFTSKMEVLSNSKLTLNHYFKSLPDWDIARIEARGNSLAELTVKIWPDFAPDRASAEAIAEARVSRRRVPAPKHVVLYGVKYPVESNLDALHEPFFSNCISSIPRPSIAPSRVPFQSDESAIKQMDYDRPEKWPRVFLLTCMAVVSG